MRRGCWDWGDWARIARSGYAPQKCHHARLQPVLGMITWSGQARLVMEDGTVRAVRQTRFCWPEANAHLYRAKQAGWTDGSVALAEVEINQAAYRLLHARSSYSCNRIVII